MTPEPRSKMKSISSEFPIPVSPLLVVVLVTAGLSGCVGGGADAASREVTSPEAFLLDNPYPTVRIDVDHVDSWEPKEEHLDLLASKLVNHSSKKDVILEEAEPIHPQNDDEWTEEELQMLREGTYGGNLTTLSGEGDEAVLQVLYINGTYATEPLLGYQERGSIVIFIEEIRTRHKSSEADATVPRPPDIASAMERHTLIHELGHAFGLVGCGIPMLMDRAAENDSCHSSNEDSVMYARKSQMDLLQEQIQGDGEGLPYEFDSHDVEDIEAFRQKSDPGRTPSVARWEPGEPERSPGSQTPGGLPLEVGPSGLGNLVRPLPAPR
jgi:hypothetical protein